MYANPPYWRHMGWGEPAAYNGVVSLVYAAAQHRQGDPGDVFYIRSTDIGVTFSAPLQLNTDTDYPSPVDAQPFGQRVRQPFRHVVRRDAAISDQLPAVQSVLPVTRCTRASPSTTA